MPHCEIVEIAMMYQVLELRQGRTLTFVETHLDTLAESSTPGLESRTIGVSGAVAIMHGPVLRIKTKLH